MHPKSLVEAMQIARANERLPHNGRSAKSATIKNSNTKRFQWQFVQTLTGYRSERESLKSQAVVDVWYAGRQWVAIETGGDLVATGAYTVCALPVSSACCGC
jgi:hypothetical protein